MSPISNQVNGYNPQNLNNIGVGISNKSSDVNLSRQLPSVGSSSNARSKDVSNMPKNFIVPEGERLNKLAENFDDKALKQMGAVECTTCATRTYQDGSDDPGVSFKAPTHLSPAQAATAVMSHEQEHVVNERAAAEEKGHEVISQSVQIFTAVCPECGKSYVSGGVTKTTTAGPSEAYAKLNESNSEGNLLDVSL